MFTVEMDDKAVKSLTVDFLADEYMTLYGIMLCLKNRLNKFIETNTEVSTVLMNDYDLVCKNIYTIKGTLEYLMPQKDFERFINLVENGEHNV